MGNLCKSKMVPKESFQYIYEKTGAPVVHINVYLNSNLESNYPSYQPQRGMYSFITV